ncbi:gluconokinase [Pasteurellaceae bacterium HPA106]|uniref:gluconokinase n=1 Tax=Spirabiliibacterium pneumoniae TaxID=221400 RepID=UPI001AAC82F1|nr:gluconokinase [Spirabiliibacterium pneumoniae]MBE2897142.1 gluconokinase [Spirabiliibacterium pneumoniae]
MSGLAIILMGVSGTGKSSLGQAAAQALNLKFIDGDDLHPRANILKMAQGLPLNDTDRQPWLERINDAAFSIVQKNEVGIIVCSALKKAYRDRIRQGNDKLRFIYLEGDFAVIAKRLAARQGHFMGQAMLQSQFEALEPPHGEPDVLTVAIAGEFNEVLMRLETALYSILPKNAQKQVT